jgi:hypothetical protein
MFTLANNWLKPKALLEKPKCSAKCTVVYPFASFTAVKIKISLEEVV